MKFEKGLSSTGADFLHSTPAFAACECRHRSREHVSLRLLIARAAASYHSLSVTLVSRSSLTLRSLTFTSLLLSCSSGFLHHLLPLTTHCSILTHFQSGLQRHTRRTRPDTTVKPTWVPGDMVGLTHFVLQRCLLIRSRTLPIGPRLRHDKRSGP